MRLITAIAMLAGFVGSPRPGAPGYRILVASESGDIVTELTWDGAALAVVKVVPVGIMPADIDGPHNVTAAPDGSAWYVTIAHGTPYGSLWKMSAGTDSLLGRAPVEMFPTTIALTPDGALAFVANSDFHGDHPRVNVNRAGTFVYVSCMNSDAILGIDRQSLRITRRHKTGEAPGGAGNGHAAMTCMPTFVSVSPDDRRLYVA